MRRRPPLLSTGALDQFVGKSGAGSLVVKTNIDAVSGATVTTKGHHQGRKCRSGRRGSHGLRKGDEINEF